MDRVFTQKKGIIIILTGAVFLALVAGFFWFKKPPKLAVVCFDSVCFDAEIAKTQAELERGLMWKKNLDKDKGMIFLFNKESNYPFWMKNTLIYLDIIWIDDNNKVVFIKENAQPCQPDYCPEIDPDVNAKYVLEINAGLTEKFGIKIGDLVQIPPSL